MQPRFGTFLLIVVVSAIAGCASQAASVPTATAALETPSPNESEAIRFRTSFGLRSDPAWARLVAADPAASSLEFVFPLIPEEIAELNARAANAEAGSERHPSVR